MPKVSMEMNGSRTSLVLDVSGPWSTLPPTSTIDPAQTQRKLKALKTNPTVMISKGLQFSQGSQNNITPKIKTRGLV